MRGALDEDEFVTDVDAAGEISLRDTAVSTRKDRHVRHKTREPMSSKHMATISVATERSGAVGGTSGRRRPAERLSNSHLRRETFTH